VAAGALIVQAAGGKVTDFNGGDNYIFGEEIIAGCAAGFDPFFSAVNKYLTQ
jgi:myo-inositol-1(or 4)-monophosphatase